MILNRRNSRALSGSVNSGFLLWVTSAVPLTSVCHRGIVAPCEKTPFVAGRGEIGAYIPICRFSLSEQEEGSNDVKWVCQRVFRFLFFFSPPACSLKMSTVSKAPAVVSLKVLDKLLKLMHKVLNDFPETMRNNEKITVYQWLFNDFR